MVLRANFILELLTDSERVEIPVAIILIYL